jgi:hypothetical protein
LKIWPVLRRLYPEAHLPMQPSPVKLRLLQLLLQLLPVLPFVTWMPPKIW